MCDEETRGKLCISTENVSSVSGTVTAVNHLDEISELDSVTSFSLEASEPGAHIQRTHIWMHDGGGAAEGI